MNEEQKRAKRMLEIRAEEAGVKIVDYDVYSEYRSRREFWTAVALVLVFFLGAIATLMIMNANCLSLPNVTSEQCDQILSALLQ